MHLRSSATRLASIRSLRVQPWNAVLVAGIALSVVYLLAPLDVQNVLYEVPGAAAVLATLIGVRVFRPSRRLPWLLIAAGLALVSSGDWIYTIAGLSNQELPFPSLADGAYLPGYGFLVVGFLLLVRGRVPGGDRASVIDAAVVAVGVGAFAWVFVMAPITNDGSQSLFQQAVALSYPICDVLLLGVMAKLLLTPGPRVVSLRLVLGGLIAYVLADFPYAYLSLVGGYQSGQLVDAGWLVGYTCWAAAALHPSMARIAAPLHVTEARLGRGRLVLLAGASLLAPAEMVYQWLIGDPIDVPIIAAASVTLFLLVILRLSGVVRELSRTLDERQALEGELQHRALHDPLTGLANRVLFKDRLDRALRGRGHRVAVLFVDLDDFKTVNDTSGHAAGDELLSAIAGAIAIAIRAEDTAARLGGDEFAVLIGNNATDTAVTAIANRLLAAIRQPIEAGGREWTIGASIGISVGIASRATAESLMRDADIAMYIAKSHGKGQAVTFDAHRFGRVVSGLELEADLEGAVRRHEFEIHYQPIFFLPAGEVVGAEALVRWRHPVRGVIPPEEFIGLAERSGAIIELREWVLEQACRDAVDWLVAGRGCPVSVDISACQLTQPRIEQTIARVLDTSGIRPDWLTLEVTESVLLEDPAALAAIERIRGLGVHLAIDDFGTGHASLGQLARASFDRVKIDRSFIDGLPGARRSEAIVDSVLTFANRLNIEVFAEGIETSAQLEALQALGCEFGQGFHFAKPMPADEFWLWLRDRNAAADLPQRRPAEPAA